MICRYCGQEVNNGVRFCNHCGADLGAETTGAVNPFQNGQPQAQQQPVQPMPMPMPVEYQEKPYKKTNKALIVAIILLPLIILALILIPAIIGYNSDIRKVKYGSIDAPGYSDKKWGEGLDKICSDSEWKQYTDDGDHMVKYTGKKKNDGNKLVIVFKMADNRKDFSIVSITDGDMELTNEMAISLAVIEMFDGNYK